mmetsp:Transcript_14041/g.48715  ORF Transcript_14041/g.48715 Transcript_14041/m.48715 type:complete len:256 (-) Transcript_14041:192-959(-)
MLWHLRARVLAERVRARRFGPLASARALRLLCARVLASARLDGALRLHARSLFFLRRRDVRRRRGALLPGLLLLLRSGAWFRRSVAFPLLASGRRGACGFVNSRVLVALFVERGGGLGLESGRGARRRRRRRPWEYLHRNAAEHDVRRGRRLALRPLRGQIRYECLDELVDRLYPFKRLARHLKRAFALEGKLADIDLQQDSRAPGGLLHCRDLAECRLVVEVLVAAAPVPLLLRGTLCGAPLSLSASARCAASW